MCCGWGDDGGDLLMPLTKRLIPCLDVDAGRVVKGTRFHDLRDAGDPVELAARYDAEGADEARNIGGLIRKHCKPVVVEIADVERNVKLCA